MIWMECLILCALFTLMVYLISRDPLNQVYNYPPEIQEQVKSMPEYQDRIPTTKKKVGVKLFAAFFFAAVVGAILKYVNHVSSFREAFFTAFLIWSVVNLYDAVVLDILWFCHDPRFIIPGTEDMVEAYHDYWFHIKGSLIGEGIALIVCLLAAVLVQYVF